jgi:hypothetical protein
MEEQAEEEERQHDLTVDGLGSSNGRSALSSAERAIVGHT